MAEILFKNVNGNRIQMKEQEALEFEISRETSRKKKLLKEENAEKDKTLRMNIFNDMCQRLGLSEDEKEVLKNGY